MMRPIQCLLAAVLAFAGCRADSQEEKPDTTVAVGTAARIPDRVVVDAHGRAVHFRDEVLREGPVLVGFTFTRCEKSCPLLAKRLDALTEAIERLPGAVKPRIVLLSIDPEYDTPERFHQWAEGFRNGSKWTLLTGRMGDIGAIARSLTGSVPSPREHSPTLAFVDLARDVRRTLYGLASTEDVLAEISHAEPAPSRAPVSRPAATHAVESQIVGSWSSVPDWSVVAVHTDLLPSGRVLLWPRYEKTGDNIPTGDAGAKTPHAWVWDPTQPLGAPSRFVNVPNPNTNLFCAGFAHMPDGRVMVIGGHDRTAGSAADRGVVDVNLFDPTSQTWSRVANMNVERWYPTLTPLADGRMMAIGGSYSGTHNDGTPNQQVELWQLGGWSGFRQPVGSAANRARQIVGVRASDGSTDMVMRGLDNRIWRSHERSDGTFPDFAEGPVGVSANQASRIAAVALPNRGLDVYMVGLDNQMWHSVMRPDGSFPDFAAGHVGSTANKAIDLTVVRRKSGRMTAFMVGIDNHLWQSEQAADGQFPDFAERPVASRSNLATRLLAVPLADDSVELFMIGTDGRIWHSHEQPNGQFADFAAGPVGSPSNKATAIAVARGAGGRFLVHMVGLDGRLWRSQMQPNGTFPDFAEHPMGEQSLNARDVSSAAYADGSGDVYIVRTDSENVWRNRQLPNQFGWNDLEIPRTSSVDAGWYIYYPWTFVAPNGSIFVPSASQRTYWIDLAPQPTLREGPRRGVFRDYGAAVMYDSGKVLVLGGGTTTEQLSESSAETIDLNAASPAWTPTPSMHYARKQANATILPDGQVLVTGGTRRGGDPSAAYEDEGYRVLPAEIWNPETRQWLETGPMSEARTYHSTALLLPDGQVLVAGGGQGGGPPIPSHATAELYAPPYLFRGARPRITAAPSSVQYGQAFNVTTEDASSIRAVSLVRLGSVTHSFNENQRFNWLTFERSAAQNLIVHVPSSPHVTPPGHYMLFLLNTENVPSIARIVQVRPAP
ncbi:DUF1929 domain-containing protein [Pendulispora rubella]|uniref:DUF1929 domain-containing protein n=1 Tax=Pendulispora rubella TaxID=2741070 RepID=A0ABZ2KPB6_9BACT